EKMRKILVALFVLGIVVALSAPASAVDVKISGQYYVVGAFESNPSLRTEDGRNQLTTQSGRASSAAWVAQRLRLQPEFKIAEGLTLTTRFDALEKKWGDVSWGQNGIYTYDNTNRPVDRTAANLTNPLTTGANIRTQENIEWERAYVDFNTAIGRFLVGYFNTIYYGTDFLNSSWSRPGVEYMYPMGPWSFGARWEHAAEGGSYGIAGGARLVYAEADFDVYSVMTDYRWKTGAAGMQVQYYHDSYNDYDRGGFIRKMYTFNPYARATFGPLFIEAEGWYGTGDWQDFRGATTDVDLKAWAAYVNAKYTMGPWYVGGLFSYESGDDPTTLDKREGSVMQTLFLGKNYDAFLLMFNNAINTWTGTWAGYNGASINTFEDNCLLWKAYAGWNVTPKLRVEAGYGMAKADESAFVDKDYGSEFDIYATYKIYDNLSYMVGFGYWWVGDYFKGTSSSNVIDDNYLVMHKLTLSF
ncbi:MAG: hypothetical protein NTV99_08660, partial [Deltaproteobacteria bacterium]|nr:hypothetical protein [Deltaproteobacteria bacterium]